MTRARAGLCCARRRVRCGVSCARCARSPKTRPYTWSALNELRREGRLVVHAGRILDMELAGRQVGVTWRARGRSAATTILVDRVVNCTGPQYDVRHTRERLLRSLLAQGMVLPDPLGVGIMTDESGALLDASGCVAATSTTSAPCCARDIGRPPRCRSCAHTPSSWRAASRCRGNCQCRDVTPQDRGGPLQRWPEE